MKLPLALAGALIVVSSLTACGGGGDDQATREAARVKTYCAALRDAAPEVKAYNEDDPDYKKLPDYFALMHSLAKKSPTDLKEEWNILDYNITQIEKAAAAAKIEFKSIPKLLKGKLPKGAKASKLPGLVTAFAGLKSVTFMTANSRVANGAAKVCKVDLTPKAKS